MNFCALGSVRYVVVLVFYVISCCVVVMCFVGIVQAYWIWGD